MSDEAALRAVLEEVVAVLEAPVTTRTALAGYIESAARLYREVLPQARAALADQAPAAPVEPARGALADDKATPWAVVLYGVIQSALDEVRLTPEGGVDWRQTGVTDAARAVDALAAAWRALAEPALERSARGEGGADA